MQPPLATPPFRRPLIRSRLFSLLPLCLLGLFLPMSASHAQPKEANYDESKVPAYTLPDPLTLANGKKVTDAKTWRDKRRAEVLDLFAGQMYGRSPGRPKNMKFKLTSNDPKALDGKATRKEVSVFFNGDPDGPKMDILIYLPNSARKPVPA